MLLGSKQRILASSVSPLAIFLETVYERKLAAKAVVRVRIDKAAGASGVLLLRVHVLLHDGKLLDEPGLVRLLDRHLPRLLRLHFGRLLLLTLACVQVLHELCEHGSLVLPFWHAHQELLKLRHELVVVTWLTVDGIGLLHLLLNVGEQHLGDLLDIGHLLRETRGLLYRRNLLLPE